MEWIETLAAVMAGLLIRFGIPIGITAVLAWLLRKLDLRWQAEAEKRRLRAHSLGAAVRQVRCWERRDCPPEKRDACPAYATADLPCWQVFRQNHGRLLEACLNCEVFREAPVLHVP